jgi:hypothetical protein
MAEIHVTEREQFKMCRRKWKYQTLWEIVPTHEPRGALWIGTGGHYAMGNYYASGKTKDPWVSAVEWIEDNVPQEEIANFWPDEAREFDETTDLLHSVLTGYVSYAERNDDFKVVDVERPMKIRVPHTRSFLVGTLDLLVERKNRYWDVDHKFLAHFISPEILELDDQMTAYLWLIWKTYGTMPGGAIYNQFRKKIPARPQILQKGGLSKAKNIDTTYDIYMQAIRDNNLNVADYTDILEQIKYNEFYRREEVARSRHELVNFGEQLTWEIREMTSKHTHLYPHPTKDCSWSCRYRDLCLTENNGGDIESLIDANYIHAEGGRRYKYTYQ